MEYRQECAAGRLVGFIWVTFDTGRIMAKATNGTATASDGRTSHARNGQSQSDTVSTGPVITLAGDGAQAAPSEPAPSSIVLSAEQYNTLADFLINHTDFAGFELAKKSTNDWIDKVKEMSGAARFGVDVEGRAANTPSTSREDSGISLTQTAGAAGEKHAREEASTPHVNVLTGIRKKRKVEQETTTSDSPHNGASSLPIAESKQEKQPISSGGTSDGARTLSAGLVRKKPKVTSV